MKMVMIMRFLPEIPLFINDTGRPDLIQKVKSEITPLFWQGYYLMLYEIR